MQQDGWLGFICSSEGAMFLMQTSIAVLVVVRILQSLEHKVFGGSARDE